MDKVCNSLCTEKITVLKIEIGQTKDANSEGWKELVKGKKYILGGCNLHFINLHSFEVSLKQEADVVRNWIIK